MPNNQRVPPSGKLQQWWKAFIFVFYRKSRLHWLLLLLSSFSMLIGYTSGLLLSRYYFDQGGSRRWLYACTQTIGFPVCFLTLIIVRWTTSTALQPLTPRLLLVYIFLGALVAVDNLLYTWGISYLPVSTNSLLSSTQLAFNAIFALLVVRKRISSYALNAIVLVSCSSILLALDSHSDKPPGVNSSHYMLGYVVTILASALNGLLLPLIDYTFQKLLAGRSYLSIVEIQTYMSVFATLLCLIAMTISHDFAALHRESKVFKAGGLIYAMTLAWSAIAWQLAFLGTAGVIFLTSSLLAGVLMAAILPLASILAVIFFHDNFGGLKTMAMLLSLWGFVSYIYGGYIYQSESQTLQQSAPATLSSPVSSNQPPENNHHLHLTLSLQH